MRFFVFCAEKIVFKAKKHILKVKEPWSWTPPTYLGPIRQKSPKKVVKTEFPKKKVVTKEYRSISYRKPKILINLDHIEKVYRSGVVMVKDSNILYLSRRFRFAAVLHLLESLFQNYELIVFPGSITNSVLLAKRCKYHVIIS